MEKTKKISYKKIYILLCLSLIIPSIVYIFSGKKIINLISSFTFFFTYPTVALTPAKVLGTIFFIGIFVAISIIYYKILKNYKKEFTKTKKVFMFITIVSLLFFIMLPLTSTDVFYYIGTGWSEAEYGVNPYYTSVDELMQQNEETSNDEILLKMKGVWSNQTVVYGPIWPLICKILSKMSMGNLELALYIYKLFNLILHIINAYLIYKIANKRTFFAILYGINPLILFDGIANVHNELLLIFLILLALYFFIKKKNVFLTVVFLALATAVKYVAVLLIPFLILYYYRKEKLIKKIKYSCLWAILFIAVIAVCYAIYMQDFSILNGIITQQNKFSDSIFTIIPVKNIDLALKVSKGFMLAFVIIYFANVFKSLFTKKQHNFSYYIRKYNILLVLFMFGTITNFKSWYTLWLMPTLMWENSKNIKWLCSITIFAELANIIYFIKYESYTYCKNYSIILITAIIISHFIYNKKKKALYK